LTLLKYEGAWYNLERVAYERYAMCKFFAFAAASKKGKKGEGV